MRALHFFIALAVTGACAVLEYESPRLAVIDFGGTDTVVFTVPATAQANTPFDISVRSYGGGCVTKGHTEVLRTDALAFLVRPYDRERGGSNVVCTQELRVFTHTATLLFESAGTATITVSGQNRIGDPVSRSKTIEIQ